MTAWVLWALLSLFCSGFFAFSMFGERQDARLFMPGDTSHGHYQIELACSSCHYENEDGEMGFQEQSCQNCHAKDLEDNHDSHPKAKFTDPRNADRLLALDASRCVTCHTEHNPDRTHAMGVTVPKDYCQKCHQDVAENRPSHQGLGFETCSTSGCHNYHDNTALYEDFLIKHADEPDHKTKFNILLRNVADEKHSKDEREEISSKQDIAEQTTPLRLEDADFSQRQGKATETVLKDWSHSSHAKAGVNCSDCHLGEQKVWIDRPSPRQCQSCHEQEVTGFLSGKHGMKFAAGLGYMKPSASHLEFKASRAHQDMTCSSCHSSHSFNTETASFKACISCHNDQHSQQFSKSKHFDLWAEKGHKGGVSCATCHMPRLKAKGDDERVYHVQHNQNDNLRPNEKMIRSVCMDCHGLKFSIDALADPELVKRNFIGLPKKHIESIDMATSRP